MPLVLFLFLFLLGEECAGSGLGMKRSSRDSTRERMVAVRSASSTPMSERSKTSVMSFVATALTREPVAEAQAE